MALPSTPPCLPSAEGSKATHPPGSYKTLFYFFSEREPERERQAHGGARGRHTKPSRRSKLEFLHLKCIRRTKGTARQRKRSLMEENAWGKMKKVNAGNIDDCDRVTNGFSFFFFDAGLDSRV